MCGGGEERHQMKLKDKEIEEERQRERELERAKAQDNPANEIAELFIHPHPLIYLEPDYKSFRCNACDKSGRGMRYHCAQCSFDVHKICTESPIIWLLHQMPPEDVHKFGIHLEIINSFVHPGHLVAAEYNQKPFRCHHCKNVGDGLRYYCDACNITFHDVCAQNPTKLFSHLHPQHELELKLRPRSKSCEQCGTKGSRRNNLIYTCKECEFYVHPECTQLPLYLLHPLHPPHPLVLKRSCRDYRCSACSKWRTHGSKYSCTRCGLDFDHSCIMEKSIIGLGDEVRQNYTENKITVLPVANLISSYGPIKEPPIPASNNNVGQLFTAAGNILQIISSQM